MRKPKNSEFRVRILYYQRLIIQQSSYSGCLRALVGCRLAQISGNPRPVLNWAVSTRERVNLVTSVESILIWSRSGPLTETVVLGAGGSIGKSQYHSENGEECGGFHLYNCFVCFVWVWVWIIRSAKSSWEVGNIRIFPIRIYTPPGIRDEQNLFLKPYRASWNCTILNSFYVDVTIYFYNASLWTTPKLIAMLFKFTILGF